MAAELLRYYQDAKVEPRWADALKSLSTGDAAAQSRGAEYLRALLTQARKDEQSGAAPWHATPFWGSSGENPAIVLRTRISGQLAQGKPSAAVLPVIRWYLDEEPIPALQTAVMAALAKVDGSEAEQLRSELASRPHANAVVVVEALKQIRARKGKLASAPLADLCQHYRKTIREAARALNQQQGGPDPGPFDATRALRAPALSKRMQELSALLAEAPAPTAEFLLVTTTTQGKGGTSVYTRGWLLKQQGDTYELLTPHGWHESYKKQPKPGPCRENSSATCTVTITRLAPADEVARVEGLRKKDDPGFELSERGGLTGQFQGHGASLYEVMLAQWLWASQEANLAARILLPALDTLYSDEGLVALVRVRLGQVYGYQMLSAFVGDRDYPKAERLAKLLAERYQKTRFHAYAVRLAEELPKRRADFNTLKLPTDKEWAELRSKLNRAQQIDYLAQRIRLLNCFQSGQPGGVSYTDTQFAEPSGMSQDAAWAGSGGKTPVINPVVELTGRSGSGKPDKNSSQRLALTLADIPLIAPYLREDWSLLIVSFWRDFHPDRTLFDSRRLFATIINDLAKQELCKVDQLGKMSPKELEEHILQITRWAQENSGKSEGDLLLQTLEKGLVTGERWYEMEQHAEALVKLKERRAIPVMVRYLEAKKVDDLNRQGILDFCRQLDANATRETARKYLKNPDLGVRLQAAMILFQTGERGEAREELGRVLGTGDESRLVRPSWLIDAVDLLLTEGSPESRKAALLLFTNKALKRLDNEHIRAGLMRRFAAAGYPDGFRFYSSMLAITGHQLEGASYSESIAEKFAGEITEIFAPNNPEIRAIKKKTPKAIDQIPALKKWLQEQAAHPGPIKDG